MIEFGPDEIRDLLDALDRRLKKRGIAASIYVVGGAAIALGHAGGRRTADVDAVIDTHAVLDEARVLAEERGLSRDWLNTSATPYVPLRSDEARAVSTEPGLTVHVAPTDHLLAMKLVASRTRDTEDIVLLANELDLTKAQEFADLALRVYGEGQLDMLGGYEDALLVGASVERLLAKRRAREFRSGP